MGRATVLLADDHAMFAEGVERLLHDEFDVLGVVTNATDLVDSLDRLHPDVILMDLSMPGGGGLDALKRIRSRKATVRVLVLTMHAEPRLAAEALRLGAAGYVLKQSSGEDLVRAIDTVLRGHTYLSPDLTRDVLMLMSSPADATELELSPRQIQVLELVVQGRRSKEIAQALNLSPRTIESIKYEMMQTLGLHSTAELVRHALQRHLVTGEATGLPLE